MKKLILISFIFLVSCGNNFEYDNSGISKMTDGQQEIIDAKIEIIEIDE